MGGAGRHSAITVTAIPFRISEAALARTTVKTFANDDADGGFDSRVRPMESSRSTAGKRAGFGVERTMKKKDRHARFGQTERAVKEKRARRRITSGWPAPPQSPTHNWPVIAKSALLQRLLGEGQLLRLASPCSNNRENHREFHNGPGRTLERPDLEELLNCRTFLYVPYCPRPRLILFIWFVVTSGAFAPLLSARPVTLSRQFHFASGAVIPFEL